MNGEPYQKQCRRGCGKTVTIGLDNKGAWMPWDDYDARILHDCPKYEPQGKAGGGGGGGRGGKTDNQGPRQTTTTTTAAAAAAAANENDKILDTLEWIKKEIEVLHKNDKSHDEKLDTIIWQLTSTKEEQRESAE